MKYFLTLILSLMVWNTAHAQEVYDPKGLWLTENKRSVIEVDECTTQKGKMCGYIHWIIQGGMQTDSKNPDPAKRDGKMCGLNIMTGLKKSSHDKNSWQDGKIYKADDGDIYDAKIKMMDSNTMHLRGYRGISLLGKSQTWSRVDAKDYPRCK